MVSSCQVDLLGLVQAVTAQFPKGAEKKQLPASQETFSLFFFFFFNLLESLELCASRGMQVLPQLWVRVFS